MRIVLFLSLIVAGSILLYFILSNSFYSPQIKSLKSGFPIISSTFNTYVNPAYGIKLSYPSTWSEVNFGGSELLIGFVDQDENESGLVENVMLKRVESTSYSGLSAKDLANMALVSYPDHMDNFRLVDSRSYETPSGLVTYKTQYTYTDKGLEISALEVWIKYGDGDDFYRIIFSSDGNEYNNFLPTVNRIVDSFSLSNTTEPQPPSLAHF